MFTKIFLQAKAHRTCALVLMQGLENTVVEFKQSSGMAQQGFARRGQCQTAARSGQHGHPDLFLQLLQLGAHRRGRAPEPVGGFGEAVELHSGDEGTQYIKVKGRAAHGIIHKIRTIGLIKSDIRECCDLLVLSLD